MIKKVRIRHNNIRATSWLYPSLYSLKKFSTWAWGPLSVVSQWSLAGVGREVFSLFSTRSDQSGRFSCNIHDSVTVSYRTVPVRSLHSVSNQIHKFFLRNCISFRCDFVSRLSNLLHEYRTQIRILKQMHALPIRYHESCILTFLFIALYKVSHNGSCI